jgi:hypothetical protein
MYTIEIEKECGCFKKSGFENNMTFETKEEAMMRAKVMECRMNQEFCFKHYFDAVDYGDKIVIHSTLRPEDDADDDEIDIKVQMARNPVQVHFSESEEPPSGGCCGGGHCD